MKTYVSIFIFMIVVIGCSSNEGLIEEIEVRNDQGVLEAKGKVQYISGKRVRVGKWVLYDDRQDERSGEYIDGQKNGLWITDFKSYGREEGEYKNDLQIGKWTQYYANGNKKFEVIYDQNGKLAGPSVFWDKTGKKINEGVYSNDVEIGIWKDWDRKTGELGLEKIYNNYGRLLETKVYPAFSRKISTNKKGKYTFYNENGDLVKEEIYDRKGNLLSSKAFTPNSINEEIDHTKKEEHEQSSESEPTPVATPE